VIEQQTTQIICTELFNGKAHDGTIFKQTTPINPQILVLGDSGYRGIQKVHANTLFPIRHKVDIAKLSEEQKATRKARNRTISSKRMKIEHVIGLIKRFKIVADRYRNRRQRFGLRLNLICGICNFELST